MTESKRIIGQRVRDLRTSHKLTQAEFSELIDISVNFLSEIENGKKGMSQDTLFKLCSKFSISSDYILFGTDAGAKGHSASDLIEYLNRLGLTELEALSEYMISLINLRKNINS